MQIDKKEPAWTESIAVGDKEYTKKIQSLLGVKAKGRKEIESEIGFELREDQAAYEESKFNKFDNKYFWDSILLEGPY